MTSKQQPCSLPAYKVKVSARAKHVRLKISPVDGLVVVVPKRFNHALLDDLVARHAGWIEKTSSRYAEHLEMIGVQQVESLPDNIYMPALEERWTVEYIETQSASVRAARSGHQRLRISGKIDNKPACRKALRRWLLRYAKECLVPQLEELSHSCKLPFRKATVRGQRSRWGSCSSAGCISINFQLLFVSPAMLHYVLVHELCHTVHLDHSPAFHTLVASYIPDFREREAELKQAWRDMPAWLHRLQP